jgi:oxygen-independent coproporphyrinogen III oxidase
MRRVSERSGIDLASPFVGYSYAYPHKTAYRPLDPPVRARGAWRDEDRRALHLYLHVPFCAIRCGFCNLFTTTGADTAFADAYLDATERQLQAIADEIAPARFARLAIGGGTPTFLTAAQLARVFGLLEDYLGVRAHEIPTSVEGSPDTLSLDRLQVLRDRGVDRISVGIQSFDTGESKALGRPQSRELACEALRRCRDSGFATLNIDLIYGGETQTTRSWESCLDTALEFAPEEIYHYPLYVRQLTGLGRRDRQWQDGRLAAYRLARDRLLGSGYTQISMRMFRASHAPEVAGPVYCCQEDGMVGLGAGARSYTRDLHYSTEYAVARATTRSIIDAYVGRDVDSHRLIEYGFRLGEPERRRRYLIQSLLQCEGLDRPRYRVLFGADVLDHFAIVEAWAEDGFASISPDRVVLTSAGIEYSDAIGPALYSREVRQLMESYRWS